MSFELTFMNLLILISSKMKLEVEYFIIHYQISRKRKKVVQIYLFVLKSLCHEIDEELL
jgi:hypothetical protein